MCLILVWYYNDNCQDRSGLMSPENLKERSLILSQYKLGVSEKGLLSQLQQRQINNLQPWQGRFTFKTNNKQLDMYFIKSLAWEPSVVQVTHSYSRRLPALGRKLRIYLFFPIKVDTLYLESLNHAENEFPRSNLRQNGHGVPELW